MSLTEMSGSDGSVDSGYVDSESDYTAVFELVFGDIVDVRYYHSIDNESYAVVKEEIGTGYVNLVYELDPLIRLLWVFRTIDSAVWGDAMWLNNEDVVDVSGVVGEEDVETLLVTESINGMHVLNFLTKDSDVNEWRVYLMLHEDESEESDSVTDVSGNHAGSVEEPPLDDDGSL